MVNIEGSGEIKGYQGKVEKALRKKGVYFGGGFVIFDVGSGQDIPLPSWAHDNDGNIPLPPYAHESHEDNVPEKFLK